MYLGQGLWRKVLIYLDVSNDRHKGNIETNVCFEILKKFAFDQFSFLDLTQQFTFSLNSKSMICILGGKVIILDKIRL